MIQGGALRPGNLILLAGSWATGSSIINHPPFNRLSLNHLSTMAKAEKFLQLFSVVWPTFQPVIFGHCI